MRELTYRDAIHEALSQEMHRDPRVFLIGEDIAFLGGSYGVSKGLWEEFGEERVRDTPISESAIVGSAIGASLNGMRPVAEISLCDFLMVCMDQVVNQAAKYRYSTGGAVNLPMVIRTSYGARGGVGSQHTQNLYAMFLQAPGIKVVLPATPYDAKGMLLAAIRDPNPVLFFEHRFLYGLKGPVPEDDYVVPLGQAEVRREGGDLSIVATGKMVHESLAAAEKLVGRGIHAEVVDVRCLAPLDRETICRSVKKTGRALVVDEAPQTGGISGEIGMTIIEGCFDYLDAPVARLGAKDFPMPFNHALANSLIPNQQDILRACLRLLGKED